MLLKSIKLVDFRGFIGTNQIDLACTDDKNIVAILGDNTNGKSTLVQAFAWCFYGIANFENPEIYNRKIANSLGVNGSTTAIVEVVFEHEDTIYTARREEKFIRNIKGDMISPSASRFYMTRLDNVTCQTIPCGTTQNEHIQAINSIISKDLAPYFFFAGEKNHDLTTKHLGSAVKTLMGLEPLINMREHIRGNATKVSSKSVMGYYEEKQIDESNTLALAELKRKAKAEDELIPIEKRLEEIDKEIESYNSSIDDVNTKLREFGPTKQLQNDKDKFESAKLREESALNSSLKRYLSDFNDKAVSLLSIPIINKAESTLKKMDLSDKGIPGIESKAINVLLSRGVCLCGTDLNVGSLAYKNVQKYIEFLPPKAIGTIVKEMQDEMSANVLDGKEYVKTFIDDYKQIAFSVDEIDKCDREIVSINKQLAGKDIPDIDKYISDLQTYNSRKNGLIQERENLLRNKNTLESVIESAQNNYNMYKNKSSVAKEYAIYYAYANALNKWISETYDQKEKSIRSRLEQSVTNMFNAIYHGKRNVVIDENYNISIIPPADTGGLKVIQYFSYVGGLVKVTREILDERKSSDNTILTGGKYPLVLDAAFSHTDANHTKAIASQLSMVTDQLIFAVMDKDWEHVCDGLSHKISKTYNLKKISEDEVTIEEA